MTARTVARGTAVSLMGAAVLVATCDGFAQSYAGLYGWATEHGMSDWKADSFPLMVDLFIFVGELGLFLLAIDGHRLRRSALAWLDLLTPATVAASGWVASLVFNVGHVEPRFSVQATAAVPPLASMVGLLVLLRTLHRYVRQAEAAPAPRSTAPAALDVHLQRAREVFADQLAAGQIPSVRRLKAGLRVGQPRAKEVHAHLAALAEGAS